MRQLYLGTAAVACDALAEPDLATGWDRPSVLEHQTIGGLAGHLLNAGITAVGRYLDADTPTGEPRFVSAAEYYAAALDAMDDAAHEALRGRSAGVAADGPAAVAEAAAKRVNVISARLPTEPVDRKVAVIGGAVMSLDAYLETRIVELVVHLDDLARSLGREPWAVPGRAVEQTVAVGAAIGARRRPTAMVRALFRDGFADGALPVM